jgi:hypothetical protein
VLERSLSSAVNTHSTAHETIQASASGPMVLTLLIKTGSHLEALYAPSTPRRVLRSTALTNERQTILHSQRPCHGFARASARATAQPSRPPPAISPHRSPENALTSNRASPGLRASPSRRLGEHCRNMETALSRSSVHRIRYAAQNPRTLSSGPALLVAQRVKTRGRGTWSKTERGHGLCAERVRTARHGAED